jgi:hypothetical protein
MKPRFVPFGHQGPPDGLALDGTVAGTAATYSHWQGAQPTPRELLADTSTGMALRAAAAPARWLAPYAWACNNHVDADGLLSVIAACRPELALAHAAAMEEAAACGDFAHWGGAAGGDLALRLHQLMTLARADEPGWEQRAMEQAVAQAEDLLAGPWPGAERRQTALAAVEQAIARLRDQPPDLGRKLAVVRWRRERGHQDDHFAWLDRPEDEDLPLLALSTAIPPTHFQLLIEERAAGAQVRLDAPRHSWARTLALPTVGWPDCSAVARALDERDGAAGWVARPQAADAGYTCLLATTRPTRLEDEEIVMACARLVG